MDDLVKRLRDWQPKIAVGYHSPAAANTIGEAADRIEELERSRQHYLDCYTRKTQHELEVRARIEELEAALQFYKDGFRYHPKRTSTGINLSEWKPTEELLNDCGEIALAALAGKKKDD